METCVAGGVKTRSEVVGGHLVGEADGFDAVGAVLKGDVAESTFLGTGNEPGGIRRRDAADELTEVPNEALVDAALRHSVSAVVVYDLAGQLGVFVLGHGPGKGVHVDHELVAVPGLLLASLDVDDEDTVVVEDEQVRLAGEGGGVSA